MNRRSPSRQYMLVTLDDGRCEARPAADLMTWARWFEGADRQVAWTAQEGVSVSTVFLGTDHRFSGSGPPMLYETMVFRGGDGGETERYSSWDDAVAGHQAMCRKVFGGRPGAQAKKQKAEEQ